MLVIFVVVFLIFQRADGVEVPVEIEEEIIIDEELNIKEAPIIEMEQRNVVISSFAYVPQEITVQVGTMVVWRNNDTGAHTVTSDDGDELNSPLLSTGDSFSHVFDNVGTFDYHCAPHPFMQGRVIVVE
ncbi:MAG: cupredoxin family copper-binding protein [Candidatus Nealsonbacteria bacterium]|nr:cupredoxin family copper-binding protein [Candidatus Nealsonbacteria bacterium]